MKNCSSCLKQRLTKRIGIKNYCASCASDRRIAMIKISVRDTK